MTVTEQDRQWADILIAATKEGDRKQVAEMLAALHERAVMCAMVRVEKTFRVGLRPGAASPHELHEKQIARQTKRRARNAETNSCADNCGAERQPGQSRCFECGRSRASQQAERRAKTL